MLSDGGYRTPAVSKNVGCVCVAPSLGWEEAMNEQPDSDYWRSKADEYRILAESADDAEAREAFLRLAEDCDALAWRQDCMAEPKSVRFT